MNTVLVGPPGTGKGSQAKIIEKKFGFKHISAGDLLREEVKNNTVLGKKAAPIMKAGQLVDDKIVAQIIASNVPRFLGRGFVLDGFPRNIKQAQILEKLFKKLGIEIHSVFLIDSSDQEIVKRLSARRYCPVCNAIYGANVSPKEKGKCDNDDAGLIQRDDDKPEVIKQRLQLYHESADPLIKFYSKKNLVIVIDGNKSVKGVFEEISKKIREMLK